LISTGLDLALAPCDNCSMKKRGKPRDINQVAARIVSASTQEDVEKPRPPKETHAKKDPAAVKLGRKGGKKGGRARAEKLTAEQRTQIARIAAQARWKKSQD
jgi:hypothetical protein